MTIEKDPGLTTLVMLLQLHGVAADAGQISHRCGSVSIGVTEMLRCARELGLKARAFKTKWHRLARTPLPAIAALADGGFLILGKVSDDQVLVQRTSMPRPEVLSRTEFEALWNGGIVLMARRASRFRIFRGVSTSPGSWARFTNTEGFSARCSRPRCSCSSSRS